MTEQDSISRVGRMFDRFVGILTGVAVGLLVPMMFLVTGDVIGRYVFNSPIPAVFEINSHFLMVMVVFFPLAYVHHKREHVFVTLFTDRLPAGGKAFLEGLSAILGLLLYGLIGWYGLQKAILSTRLFEYIPGIVDVPVWLSKWIIPIGCLAFCLELLRDFLRQFKTVFGISR
jgi:TRAP-type C4-dicarboxylate transport system permease small subunit